MRLEPRVPDYQSSSLITNHITSHNINDHLAWQDSEHSKGIGLKGASINYGGLIQNWNAELEMDLAHIPRDKYRWELPWCKFHSCVMDQRKTLERITDAHWGWKGGKEAGVMLSGNQTRAQFYNELNQNQEYQHLQILKAGRLTFRYKDCGLAPVSTQQNNILSFFPCWANFHWKQTEPLSIEESIGSLINISDETSM